MECVTPDLLLLGARLASDVAEESGDPLCERGRVEQTHYEHHAEGRS